jgi:hypothetical protein
LVTAALGASACTQLVTATRSRTATSARGACPRPYSSNGPWNTPIGNAAVASNSDALISTIASPLTSDPTQYTYPVYIVGRKQPAVPVYISHFYSSVTVANRLYTTGDGAELHIPLSPHAHPSRGSDAQLVVWNPATGDEWGFWRFSNGSHFGASNGYHYNTRLSGSPPRGFGSRGAGVPYLAGLVRKCEIQQGYINHALAFIYPNTTRQFVYPATKSDGGGAPGQGLPEGSRLQLDPSISNRVIKGAWGCTGPCFIVAKALQKYGMYVVDTGGHSKIAVEDDRTAHWQGAFNASTVSPIPVTALQVIK